MGYCNSKLLVRVHYFVVDFFLGGMVVTCQNLQTPCVYLQVNDPSCMDHVDSESNNLEKLKEENRELRRRLSAYCCLC